MLIKLPFPDMRLSPNRKNGTHWSATNALKKAAFEYAYYATLEAVGAENFKGKPLSMTLRFIEPDHRWRDLDNMLASCKSQIDGICKALGIDDRAFHYIALSREYAKDKGALHVHIWAQQAFNQGE